MSDSKPQETPSKSLKEMKSQNVEMEEGLSKLGERPKIKPIVSFAQIIYDKSWRKKNRVGTKVTLEVDEVQRKSSLLERDLGSFFRKNKIRTSLKQLKLICLYPEESKHALKIFNRFLPFFSSLENLFLDFNIPGFCSSRRDIHWSVKVQMQSLKRLKTLALNLPRSFELKDAGIIAFAKDCRQIKQLQNLSLWTDHSSLTNKGIKQSGYYFAQLKHLVSLTFRLNGQSQPGIIKSSIENFTRNLEHISSLVKLDLHFEELAALPINFEPEGMAFLFFEDEKNDLGNQVQLFPEQVKLVPFLLGLKGLRTLILKLSTEEEFCTLHQLQSLESLRELSLDLNCRRQEKSIKFAMESLHPLKQIKILTIKINYASLIPFSQLIALGESLAAMNHIENIHLFLDMTARGPLDGKQFDYFFQSLSPLKNIRTFAINFWESENHLRSRSGVRCHLYKELQSMTSLETLNVRTSEGTRMTFGGIEVLSQHFASFIHLKTLSVLFDSDSPIQSFEIFTDNLVHLPKLQNLKLDIYFSAPETDLKDTHFKSLGKALAGSTSLEYLDLNLSLPGLFMTETGVKSLVKQITSSKSLQIINFALEFWLNDTTQSNLKSCFEEMNGIKAYKINDVQIKGPKFLFSEGPFQFPR